MIDKVDIDKLIEEAMDNISKGNAGYCTIKISAEGLSLLTHDKKDLDKSEEVIKSDARNKKILYLCDRTQCDCCYEGYSCSHTTDIKKAKNFKEVYEGLYMENERHSESPPPSRLKKHIDRERRG